MDLKKLRKILHDMGFRFTKMEDNRKLLMEKHDVQLKRIEYLDKIQKFRNEQLVECNSQCNCSINLLYKNKSGFPS